MPFAAMLEVTWLAATPAGRFGFEGTNVGSAGNARSWFQTRRNDAAVDVGGTATFDTAAVTSIDVGGTATFDSAAVASIGAGRRPPDRRR